MKVIFNKDVKSIGRRHDVKDVADGYAINFLFPKNLAELATAKALIQLEKHKVQHEAEKNVQADLLIKNIKQLEGVVVELAENANEKGHLFAAIHNDEIIKAVKDQVHIDLLPEFIHITKPIKEVGDHTVNVKIRDTETTFKVTVNAK